MTDTITEERPRVSLSWNTQDAPQAAQPVAETPAAFSPGVVPAVDGAAMLDGAVSFLERFWIAPYRSAYWIAAAWAAHTWLTDSEGKLAWFTTPRIAFVSDEPKSGKSRGMELLGQLCPSPEQMLDPTGPALLKAINERNAVPLIDEVDQLFGRSQGAKAVRTIINGGYRKGAEVSRVSTAGSTFAPVALAGLASSFMANPSLEPTRSRCIIIYCQRPPAGVKPAKYREQLHAGLGTLAGQAVGMWVRQNATEILTAWPDLPEHLDGREEDIWQDLFSIAQVAGGPWPDRIWEACMQLTTGSLAPDEPVLPPQERLVRDLIEVWPEDLDEAGLATLAERLAKLPGAPWGSMWSSPLAMITEIPLTTGLMPVRVSDGGARVVGYRRADLEAMQE